MVYNLLSDLLYEDNNGDPLYMRVLKSESLTILSYPCWILQATDDGLECPDYDVLMIQRVDDQNKVVMENNYFWYLHFQDEDWWAQVIHINSNYNLKFQTRVFMFNIVVFPMSVGIVSSDSRYIIMRLCEHYLNQSIPQIVVPITDNITTEINIECDS